MRAILFIFLVTVICVFSVMLIGVVCYIGSEIFAYFYYCLPVEFNLSNARRLFRMCLVGGGILGLAIGVFSILGIKGF